MFPTFCNKPLNAKSIALWNLIMKLSSLFNQLIIKLSCIYMLAKERQMIHTLSFSNTAEVLVFIEGTTTEYRSEFTCSACNQPKRKQSCRNTVFPYIHCSILMKLFTRVLFVCFFSSKAILCFYLLADLEEKDKNIEEGVSIITSYSWTNFCVDGVHDQGHGYSRPKSWIFCLVCSWKMGPASSAVESPSWRMTLWSGSEVPTRPTLPSSPFPFPVLWEVSQMWILFAECGPYHGTDTIYSEKQEPPTALMSLRFVLSHLWLQGS